MFEQHLKTPLRAIQSLQVLLNGKLQPACIVIENGIITAIDAYMPERLDCVDIGDKYLLPGVVDTHVHVNEPGRTDWEGFDTATHAAAAGGITTLVDMPLNCIPVTISSQALAEKLAVIGDKLWVDTGFWGGATADNLKDLPELLDAGVLGVKSFTIHSGIDEFKQVNLAQLTDAMREVAKRGLVHLVHAELDDGHHDNDQIGVSYQKFLQSRPASWENNAIAMVIEAMRQLKSEGLEPRAHIVHLSAASALPMIKQAKQEGLQLSVETCPHYLVFHAETIPDGATTFKCCPPIRELSNCDALWQGLADGVIDCIVSDHSPCTPQLKHIDSGDIEAAWGGISGLQFGLSLIFDEGSQRGFSIAEIMQLMSTRSAQIAGIDEYKGEIALGKSADFCVFDPQAQYTISAERIYHKHKVTPYQGKQVQGEVIATVLGGQLVFYAQQFVGKATGKPILLKGSKT